VRLLRSRIFVAARGRADGTSQCASLANRLTELLGQVGHQLAMRQVAMRPVELKPQQFREGEVLKDCYDIGEGLVKSRHIDVRLLLVVGMNTVEQCMGR